MTGMGVYAYAAPPPGDPREVGEPWPRTDERFVIPSGGTTTITLDLHPHTVGLKKLRERLKSALRDSDAMLDMDEVGAMVWLESLR